MLKVELHTHINADPKDKKFITYSAKQLINEAAKRNFDVLAITCHNLVYQEKEIKEYAKNKDLLLILGVEKDIEGKHVLIYNITPEEAKKIKSFENLINLKKEKNLFIIAPHPFHYDQICLNNKIIEYLDLFDAWEYSFFHTFLINPNKKTIRFAKKYNKPIVGNSDVHFLKDLGRTYSLIDSEKNEHSLFQAIKEKKVKIVTNPLSLRQFFITIMKIFLIKFKNKIKNKLS